MDILQRIGGLDAISGQLGISPQDAQAGAGALLPSILHGFGQKAAADEGAAAPAGGGLADILAQLGGGGLATNVTSPEPTEVDKGNDILGQIFGSKDVSRDVAAQASQSSGVSPDVLKKMLPILAMLVGGYMSSQGGGGGMGSIIGSILGGLGGNQMGGNQMGGGQMGGGQMGGGMGGMLGSVLGSFLGGRR